MIAGLFLGVGGATLAFVWWMRRLTAREDSQSETEETPASTTPHQSLWH